MYLRLINGTLKSISALRPEIDIAAKEGGPALGDRLQHVREEAVEARARRKARQLGEVRQVLDPVLDGVRAKDWAQVQSLLDSMSDNQLGLLGDAVLERHDEVSAQGGPAAGLALSGLIAGERQARRALELERKRSRKLARVRKRSLRRRPVSQAPPEPVAAETLEPLSSSPVVRGASPRRPGPTTGSDA